MLSKASGANWVPLLIQYVVSDKLTQVLAEIVAKTTFLEVSAAFPIVILESEQPYLEVCNTNGSHYPPTILEGNMTFLINAKKI